MVSTKRIAVMEFVPGEVVGGIKPDSAGPKFGAKLLLLSGEALELGLGRFPDREADEEVLEQGRDGRGLLSSLNPSLTVEVVVNADGDVLHDIGMLSQFHSLGKREMLCPFPEQPNLVSKAE